MSDLLEQAKKIQTQRESTSASSSSHKAASLHPSNDAHHHDNIPASTLSSNTSSTSPKEKVSKKVTETTQSSKPSAGFAGMKKGFLFGGANKNTSPSGRSTASAASSKVIPNPVGVEGIPLIRPKEGSGDNKEQYRIEEVQEALKTSAPLLQSKEWVTDDLLTKLEKHPRLAKQLADPRLSQALSKFQTNPQQAMQEYQDSAEIQQFFKDFCSILGDHFTSFGGAPSPTTNPPSQSQDIRTQDAAKAPNISIRQSTNPKQATSADEAKMKQILSDPEIMEILKDQRLQRLMETLRSNPDEGHRIVQSADPEMRKKIHKLVEAGLLGFSS